MSDPQTRIDRALERLTQEAGHTFRHTTQGQLIEALGCILTGRQASWWPPNNPGPR